MSAWDGANKGAVVTTVVTSLGHDASARAPAAEVVNFAVRYSGGFIAYYSEIPDDARYEALVNSDGPKYDVLLRRVGPSTTAHTKRTLHVIYAFIPGAGRYFLSSDDAPLGASLTLFRQDDPADVPRAVTTAQVAGAPDSDCSGFSPCSSAADCDHGQTTTSSEVDGALVCAAAFSNRCGAFCLPKALACMSECGTSECTLTPRDPAEAVGLRASCP